MKKRLYLITTILLSAAALSLSSCLKDSRYVDLTKVGTIVEFPFGGQVYFGSGYQALTGDTIVTKFAVNVASPTVPTTATPITFDVDNPATVTAYDNANKAVFYYPMPANAYVFTQNSITILAGHRDTAMTVTVYANLLDPSKSYMLPITIKSAGGLNISGNQGTMYFHIIGNVFAGSYTQNFYRYNNFSTPPPAGTTPSGGSFYGANAAQVIISPVTPTEFQVVSGYYLDNVNYQVTFNQVDATHYNNFQIVLDPAGVSSVWTPAGITVTQPAVFGFGISPAYDPTVSYTYADALKYFTFQYTVQNSSGYRYCIDNYVHN